MSLPSSQPLPDDINELTPARQRHLRRMPRSASPAERDILMESLLSLTATAIGFLFVTGPGCIGDICRFLLQRTDFIGPCGPSTAISQPHFQSGITALLTETGKRRQNPRLFSLSPSLFVLPSARWSVGSCLKQIMPTWP